MPEKTYTVAHYLADRLSRLGLRKIFGVPGNHLGPCLSTIKAHSPIEWVGMTNEINAGFAADGYARVKGLGVVGVTYGVGAFSLINTIGGAFVERVPLLVVNASPTNEQWLNFQALGLLTSHMSPRQESNLAAYRQVTASASVITNPALAPRQVDAALEMCLTELRPVYLEIREDVFASQCPEPVGELAPRPRRFTSNNKKMLDKAVSEATEKISSALKNRRPSESAVVLWGGVEIQRFGLQSALLRLADATRFPIFTTIMGKGIISEYHPRWHGVYNGKASLPDVRKAFEKATCKIALGAWTTSKNLGGTKALGEDWIKADHDGVSVGSRYFPGVELGRFIDALRISLSKRINDESPPIVSDLYALLPTLQSAEGSSGGQSLETFQGSYFAEAEQAATQDLSFDLVIRMVNTFLNSDQQKDRNYAVVADAGFSLLSAQNLRLREADSFHSQASWLSIGYSLPAAVGFAEAGLETEERPRVLVFIGDGAFQETCQALSDHTRLHHDSVIFVFNNQDFYGIEQMLVDASFFEKDGKKKADHYNLLHPWNYAEFHRVFGASDAPMRGEVVENRRDLERVLEVIAEDDREAGPLIVQINLARKCYPAAIGYKIEEKKRQREAGTASQQVAVDLTG